MNIKNNIIKNFTVLPNALIKDSSLTDRARFLFCYMASMPADWVFYQRPLAAALGYGVDTLRKYIDELIAAGWITKTERREAGRFDACDYTLNEKPMHEKYRVGKKPSRQNPSLLNKDLDKELTSTNNISASEKNEDVVFGGIVDFVAEDVVEKKNKAVQQALFFCTKNPEQIQYWREQTRWQGSAADWRTQVDAFISYYLSETGTSHPIHRNPLEWFALRFPAWLMRVPKPHVANRKTKQSVNGFGSDEAKYKTKQNW